MLRFYRAREPNQFADFPNLFFERQLRELLAHFGFHWAATRFPFGQTTGANPSLRFSARTLPATRRNARSARATKSGRFFAPFLFRLFLIGQSNAGLNLHHQLQKSPSVLLEDRGCPKSPTESRAADNHQSDDQDFV